MSGFSNRRACIKATLLRPGRILIVLEPAETTSLRCGQLESGKKPISYASLIRPSDRRGPGRDPRPQCAFEKSVLNVSCNSHQITQLAAFFIDP
ncbi:hypothetical protein CDAR_106861 [Caerostris darwini]|uniref:Ribosomal protein L14 n=1 Tax=Caerostris darwini TaxID=1538125 RepID=A0AAV4NKZ8_9ARAC|nr:hypothetical protein CDAR_195321 [Caerostris darwini]GIY73175.1 hypothetical protein CDAR_106861 [Caerostris darwini]